MYCPKDRQVANSISGNGRLITSLVGNGRQNLKLPGVDDLNIHL